MKILGKRFLGGLAIVAISVVVYSFAAFEDPLLKIERQLDKWTTDHPVEKVYLHLDKPYYAAGDDIWLKAYVTGGSYNQPTTLSGVINIELLNQNGGTERSLKLKLDSGVAWGAIALPDTLAQGNYRLRAYTNYMRNAGDGYFFDQPITIIGSIFSKAAKANGRVAMGVNSASVNNTLKPDVQFFPESGKLVAGIPTRVAFKAVGSDGIGADVTGTITDDKGRQITAFRSTHLGMGVLDITPLAGVAYTANLTYTSGITARVQLPAVAPDGYVLNVTDAGAELRLKVSTTNTANALTLVGQSAGKIYYVHKAAGGSINILKNKFPDGILQFTLFNAAAEPLAERPVFIHNTERLNVTLTTDKESYTAREAVTLKAVATNRGNKPAVGSFSVAVLNESRVPVDENAQNNILASLLLTGDLRGYIEQPAYYFNNPSDQARADLDLLMMTQGYRRFDWKAILADNFPADAYQPERDLSIAGTVTTTGGKPVPNGKVKIIDFDDISLELDTVTDANGRFNFKGLAFNDSARFIVQARDSRNKKDVVIKMDSVPPPSAGKTILMRDVLVTDAMRTYSQASNALFAAQRNAEVGNHVISLREVIIREKRQALKHSANLNGPGNADEVLLARDLATMPCVRLADCLQGRLLGVTFRNGIAYSTRSNRPMQIIVDGVYVSPDYLNTVNYFDIQAIEVLRNASTVGVYGSRGANGILLITSKRGDDREPYTGSLTGRGIKPYYPKGYNAARTFYSPRYERSGENKTLADLRTTIYWNPNVKPDKDGKISVQYYNATAGTYRIVLEGIDTDGNLTHKVLRYTVR